MTPKPYGGSRDPFDESWWRKYLDVILLFGIMGGGATIIFILVMPCQIVSDVIDNLNEKVTWARINGMEVPQDLLEKLQDKREAYVKDCL